MTRCLTIIFFLLYGAIFHSQSTYTATIDTNCECADGSPAKMDGTFGLFGTTYRSGVATDTLIQELSYIPEQTFVLPNQSQYLSNFKLMFVPSDSTRPSRELYIGYYQGQGSFHFDCYFFYQSFPSFLDQLEKGESLVISSSYFGNTHEGMSIPVNTLTIVRKGKKFYAGYSEGYANHLQVIVAKGDNQGSSPSVDVDSLLLLSNEQLSIIREFEKEIVNYVLPDFSPLAMTKTTISWDGKFSSIYGRSYLSSVLWYLLIPDKECEIEKNKLLKEAEYLRSQKEFVEALTLYQDAGELSCGRHDQSLWKLYQECTTELIAYHKSYEEECSKLYRTASEFYFDGNIQKAIELYERYLELPCGYEQLRTDLKKKIEELKSELDQN